MYTLSRKLETNCRIQKRGNITTIMVKYLAIIYLNPLLCKTGVHRNETLISGHAGLRQYLNWPYGATTIVIYILWKTFLV